MNTRQQIMDALATRLKTITIANGYNTDVGLRVYDWLDRDLAESELDALIYRDNSSQAVLESFDVQAHIVRVQIEGKTKQARNTAARLRAIVEDVLTAIGTDSTFGDLALGAEYLGDALEIQQEDKIMGSVAIDLNIQYLTDKWSY